LYSAGSFFILFGMECYDKALYLLSMREHSEKELRDKLKSKAYKAEDIDSSIVRLKKENYLSDSRFCEAFIRSRLKKNPEGKQILILRLSEKGIDKAKAREAVDLYFEEHEEEVEEIYKAYKDKILLKKGEEKGKAFLFRKGLFKGF